MNSTRTWEQPLSPDDQSLLEAMGPRLRRRLSEGGLTRDEMRQLVAAIRRKPHLGEAMLELLLTEADGQAPGLGLFNLRWD